MKLFDQFSTRDLNILKVLMHHDEDCYVTSSYLANMMGKTSRTIKNDIKRLNQLLEEWKVAKIISIKGKGYKIISLNNETYAVLCNAVQMYNEYYANQEKTYYQRKLHILKLFLTNFEMTFDELTEKLFINNTSLIQHLGEVKQQLNSWGIEMYSSSKKIGITNYNEFNYRLLAADLSIDYFYHIDKFDMIELTESLVGNKDYYKSVRKKVLDYLREIDYVLLDNEANALPLYICVAQKRINSNHLISESLHTDLKQYKEFEIARNLFAMNQIECSNEAEILSLASVLICMRDFDITSLKDHNYIYDNLLNECRSLYSYIIENIEGSLWDFVINTNTFKQNQDNFISIIMKIVVNVKYGNSKAIKLIQNQSVTHYEFSQFAIEMSRIMLYFIQKKYRCPINGLNFLEVIYFIDYILSEICEYSKKRIALCSYLGRTFANQERKRLLNKFEDYIESIKIFNFYEIRKEKFENYDLIINDRDVFINKYPLPCISYDFLDENRDAYIFKEIFDKRVSENLAFQLTRITKTISDVVYTNILYFFKTLSLVYAKKGKEEDMFSILKAKHMIIPYDDKEEVLFIIIDSSLSESEFIDIYQVKEFAKYAFVICLKNICHNDLEIINKMMSEIKKDEKYVKEIYINPLEVYQKLIELCTKR